MDLPKISVVVPVYNVEKYLERCLDNLINQTYLNLEIIVINDCTPDNSQNIIDIYLEKDSRVISIIHKENKGLGGARNTGIKRATGKYISFVDSDDWIEIDSYAKIIENIKNRTPDIIKFGRFQEYGTHQIKLSPVLSKNYYENGWISLKESINLNKGRVAAWDNIYRVEFVKNNSLFFKEKLLYEDAYFTIRAQVLAKGILIIDDFFYHYVKDDIEDTITNTIKLRDSEVLVTVKLLDDFLQEQNRVDILKSEEYSLMIFKWIAHHVIYRYQETKGNDKIKDEVISKILNDKYFKKHLKKILKSRLSMKYKVPSWMLLNTYGGFKIFMKSLFFLKKMKIRFLL